MRNLPRRLLPAFLALGLLAVPTFSAPSRAVRKQILDAIRPEAARQAGQPVLIRVDRLNLDHDWAILVGELVTVAGGDLDWSKARGCQLDLDKMLWAVVHRTGSTWRIEQLEICACEPPYWYLGDKPLDWPCGVYDSLSDGAGGDLATKCRLQRGKP
ncbi:MAG: hypothetical protein H6686_01390 [Fibrobacteria bacterium]|nr:hypothetical protein [Fibrobacteria bacterium]